MSIFGHIVAGAAEGLGKGMYDDAIAKREEALQNTRIRYQQQKDAEDREIRKAERKEDQTFALEKLDRDYTNRQGLLATGAVIAADKDERSHGYRMAEIKTKALNDREQAKLNSQLRMGESAAELRLRDSLESGDIRSVEMGEDGQLYGVTDRGLVPTGVMGSPKSSGSSGDNGGGRLTESEQENAFRDEQKKWRDGGKKGEEPKRADFIGMTRDAYTARRGRPVRIQLPRDAAPSGQEAGRMSERDLAISQLRNEYANATPDRYPGLFRNGRKIPLQEAERMIAQGAN